MVINRMVNEREDKLYSSGEKDVDSRLRRDDRSGCHPPIFQPDDQRYEPLLDLLKI